MVLDDALLNTQHYKVRMKDKVELSREWSSALPTLWCSIYWKEPSGYPWLRSPTLLTLVAVSSPAYKKRHLKEVGAYNNQNIGSITTKVKKTVQNKIDKMSDALILIQGHIWNASSIKALYTSWFFFMYQE